MKELIRKFAQTAGPSGYESAVRNVIREELKSYASNIQVDTLGNLIVRVGEKTKNGLSILVAAHMDEIGVIVSHVEKNGLVRFSNIGTVFPRFLPGSRVVFLNGTRGVINNEKPEDITRIPKFEMFFIDVGATSDKDCPVRIGDLAVFEGEFHDYGANIVSKALDNRAACALLIETIKQIKQTPHELIFVFSTQEEVGSRGALTAAFGIDADLGFAVDVTPASHILGTKMQCELGKGPAIKVRDVNFISDPSVVNWMVDGAKKVRVPYQLEILDVGSTDARSIQMARSGVASGALSIPCRYVHSPSEMINMADYQNMITLMVRLLTNPVSFGKK